MSVERPPPQNLAAEESVLGAILLAGATGAEASTATIEAVAEEGLRREHFYRESHALIFDAALALAERGQTTAVLVVEAELRRRGLLDRIEGGSDRLRELAAIVPAISNAPHFARLVVEEAVRRELFSVGLALQAVAQNGALPDDALRERAARALAERQTGGGVLGIEHGDVLALKVPPTKELVKGIVEAGTVGTIAALPETFKSWLAVEIAHKVASGGGLVLGRKVVRQGPVGYWWQDDSERNEVRRIQSYARNNAYTDLPIRWHLNEGLSLPDDLARLREEIEREGQVLVVLRLALQLPAGGHAQRRGGRGHLRRDQAGGL